MSRSPRLAWRIRFRRATSHAAAAALLVAACGGEARNSWLKMPDYPSAFVVAPGGDVAIPVGPSGDGVEPLVITLEGSDGEPVAPPLAAEIPLVSSGGDCGIQRLGPSSVFVWHMCPDIPYLRAVVTAEPGAAQADVPLRARVDYHVRPWGPSRQALAPLAVSIRPP